MRISLSGWGRLLLEAVLLTALACIAWRGGAARLETWNGPAGSLTNDLFVPAVMMNAGRGFVNVEASDIPELRAFLDFQKQDFDIALAAREINEIPLHPFQEFHRYLIYTVAGAWRLFGVNWDAVKILILFYLILAAWCVYGICRMAMGPVFSLAASAAFVHAQAVMWTLPILRDFVKAPFILGLLLLLGATIRWRLSWKQCLSLALLAGLLLGVGMGFRRDMMVFLPISVLYVAACRLRPVARPWVVRTSAAVLLLSVYGLSGLPIHAALREHGYVAAHDTIMGFASFSDHELGVLEPASYEKHYLLNDLFCTLRAHDAARRGITFPREVYRERCNEPEFDLEMKQAFVFEMAKTFPADMLARAYAAVLRLATAIINSNHPIMREIELRGLWFVVVGLLLLAAGSPIRASLALGLLCYFCGCTSIQFAIRHAFHMSFVPYFFAGFVFYRVWSALLRRGRPCPAACAKSRGVRLAVAVAWGVAVMFLFYAPLLAARAVQTANVDTLHRGYAEAVLEPVAYETFEWNGRALFAPIEGRPCRLCQTMGMIYDIQTRHLAASFKQVDRPLDLLLAYEWEGLPWDFSAPATFNLAKNAYPADLHYFFPVHETTTCTDWNHFVGLSLPLDQAHLFTGFYQVADIEALGLLMNMVVPSDDSQFQSFQRLRLPWNGSEWTSYRVYDDFDPFSIVMDINGRLSQGAVDEAVDLARRALEQRPHSIQFTFLLAETLERAGQGEQAEAMCLELIDLYPNSFVLTARLNRYFEERGGAARRAQAWSAILETHPDYECAAAYLAQAQADMTALENAPVP